MAAYSWRMLVIAAAAVGILWLVGRLWVVFLPLLIATLLTRVLAAPTAWLRRRGWRPAPVAAVVLVGFLAALSATVTLLGVAVEGQVDRIAPTVSEAIDDVEEWLVEEAPVEVSRQDISRFRADARESIRGALRSSTGTIVSGAVVAAEVLVSLILGLIITFFAIKDGGRFTDWVQRQLPADRRELSGRLGRRAWHTLGGYLRGAALLGVVEGFVIAVAIALVGGQLAIPVGVLTFLLAFIPFAGAVVAGAIAVLVTLATAGGSAALIVLAVAVGVQQLDNDLLAPVVYGRSLRLHPVVVLLALAGGGALFGFAGTFLAVPVTAVVVNVLAEARLAGTEGEAVTGSP